MVSDGARQLRMLARDLDRAGKELRRELPKALRDAARPMTEAIVKEALETLPKRGGFAEYIAKASITVSTRTGVSSASVRLVGRKRKAGSEPQVDLPAVNRGRLRHPTYGHSPWVTQMVPPGFWDRGVARSAAEVDKRMQEALDRMRRRIEQAGI